MTDDLPRRRLLAAGLAGAVGGPLTWAALARTSAVADQALDVMLLQTSASIENVVIAAYDVALGLPFIGPATGTPATPATPTSGTATSGTATTTTALAAAANSMNLRTFLVRTRDHHAEHLRTFNEAVAGLGGRAQTGNNPALADVLARERPGLTDAGKVIELLLRLETAAAHTYQHNVPALVDINGRRLTASITGVESQHVASLLIARALVANRTPELFSLDPANVARLPADIGKIGFPHTINTNLDQARPAAEGAVK